MPKKSRKEEGGEVVSAALPSVRLYRRIAVTFLLLTVGMLGAVLYLATVRADIRVETAQTPVETEFFVRVVTEPQANEDVPGALFEETVEDARTFEVSGEGEEIPAKAHGVVTIVNESGVSQPLVTTTRLLSEAGVLFRITEGVTVPAHGQVRVNAAADVPGRDGEIAATRFSIPGLASARQAEVYARSDQAMVGGVERRAIVTDAALEQAHGELLSGIQTTVDARWREGISAALDGVIIAQATVEKRADTEPGTETGSYTVSTIAKNTGVYYDRARLGRIAEAKLLEHVPEGMALASIDRDAMAIELDEANVVGGVARLHVRVQGVAVLKATADVLDRERLVGLTAGEAEAYLESQESIRDAQVTLSPFWVRRIPRLRDHIYVEIVDVGEENDI